MSTNDTIRDDTPVDEQDFEKLMLAAEAASSRKALQMTAIDIRKIASFAEFFLVCSGTSTRQVQAIADEVMDRLKKDRSSRPLHIEGYEAGTWILLDYGDLIVHVFTEEAREFYQLERLWRDADRVALPAAMTAE